MSKEKWFHPKRESGWEKGMSERARRRIVYENTKDEATGRYARLLLAEEQMNGLAHVQKDPETKRKALSDASYFKRQRERIRPKSGRVLHKRRLRSNR